MKTSKRIGPCMKYVAEMVKRCPGISRAETAAWVGPHGSLCYGYQTVNRAIAAGIVKVGPRSDGGRGAGLYPV